MITQMHLFINKEQVKQYANTWNGQGEYNLTNARFIMHLPGQKIVAMSISEDERKLAGWSVNNISFHYEPTRDVLECAIDRVMRNKGVVMIFNRRVYPKNMESLK
jgi:hypothetical protein